MSLGVLTGSSMDALEELCDALDRKSERKDSGLLGIVKMACVRSTLRQVLMVGGGNNGKILSRCLGA